MKKLIIIFGLLTMGAAAQVQGPDQQDAMANATFQNTISAGSFANTCQYSRHGYTAGQCIGMIDGYVTAITNLRPLVLQGKTVNPSLDPHVSRIQVVHVFLSYISKHPEMENQECYAVLVAALMDAKLLHVK